MKALDIAAARTHRGLSPQSPNCRRTKSIPMKRAPYARLALDAARQRGPLCAGRHSELSEFGADECGPCACGGRGPHRDGDACKRRQYQSAGARCRQARRRARDLSHWRRAGGCRVGLWHAAIAIRAGGQDRRPRQQPMSTPPPSAKVFGKVRHRFHRGAFGNSRHQRSAGSNDPEWIRRRSS